MNSEIQNFISDLNNSKDKHERKRLYYEIIKEFHPDKNEDSLHYHEITILINYIYSKYGHNSILINLEETEYDEYLKNGKYEFENRYGTIEKEKDRQVFIFKLGFNSMMKASDIIHENPISLGIDRNIINEATSLLMTAVKHFNYVIANTEKNNWTKEAQDKKNWAFKINERITKQFVDENNSLIVQ
jgi:hypothetical protein